MDEPMFDVLAGEVVVEMRVLVEEVDMSVVEACVAGGRGSAVERDYPYRIP